MGFMKNLLKKSVIQLNIFSFRYNFFLKILRCILLCAKESPKIYICIGKWARLRKFNYLIARI